MKLKKTKNQKGFTVVEMLVTTALSTIIAFAIFSVLRSGDNQAQTAQVKMTIQDSAREGLYKMVQEIRLSAPTRVAIGGAGANIQFNIPDPNNAVGANYKVNWNASHLIRYALGGLNNRQIIRTNLTTNQTSVIANDVTSLAFTGNSANPTVVTVNMGVQRTLVNNRVIPAVPLQMIAQAEVRNS